MALWAQIKKAQILGDSGRGAGGCLVKEVRLGVRGGACAALGPWAPDFMSRRWSRAGGQWGVRPSSRNVDFRAYLKGAWWLLKQKEVTAVGRGWESPSSAPIAPSSPRISRPGAFTPSLGDTVLPRGPALREQCRLLCSQRSSSAAPPKRRHRPGLAGPRCVWGLCPDTHTRS